jgi:4-aminobutyrate aminotransferase-like enzyme
LQDGGEAVALRFAKEQMDVLWHDDVTQNNKAIATAHSIQDVQEEIAFARGAEKGLAAITTGGDKVQIARAVVTLKVSRHNLRRVGQLLVRVCDG